MCLNNNVFTMRTKTKRKNNQAVFFLFVCSCQLTRTDVRPSYDGQSLMGKDSVAKRRSVCQGVVPQKTALETYEQLAFASCSRRRSYANKFAPEP